MKGGGIKLPSPRKNTLKHSSLVGLIRFWFVLKSLNTHNNRFLEVKFWKTYGKRISNVKQSRKRPVSFFRRILENYLMFAIMLKYIFSKTKYKNTKPDICGVFQLHLYKNLFRPKYDSTIWNIFKKIYF